MIVFISAAFEALLNEIICWGMLSTEVERERLLTLRSLTDKYMQIPGSLMGGRGAIGPAEDLESVLNVRNEIVHYIPRPTRGEEFVPSALLDLHHKGLFVVSPNASPDGDLVLAQKLPSYKLAYWCCETIANCVQSMSDAVDPKYKLHNHLGEPMVGMFRFYESITKPADIPAFDRQFGIDWRK